MPISSSSRIHVLACGRPHNIIQRPQTADTHLLKSVAETNDDLCRSWYIFDSLPIVKGCYRWRVSSPFILSGTGRLSLLLTRRTSPDYNDYLSTWVEYKNFLWWVEFEYNDSWYSNSTHERGHSTHETWVKLEYNLFFQTSLTLNIDKVPRNLWGPHLYTPIHTYVATNLNKWETV